jgi:hypothetical protein
MATREFLGPLQVDVNILSKRQHSGDVQNAAVTKRQKLVVGDQNAESRFAYDKRFIEPAKRRHQPINRFKVSDCGTVSTFDPSSPPLQHPRPQHNSEGVVDAEDYVIMLKLRLGLAMFKLRNHKVEADYRRVLSAGAFLRGSAPHDKLR